MEVIEASEMARIEKLAFDEGASDDAFMQKAAQGIADAVECYIRQHHLEDKVTFIAGKGNNGGDAFCTALLLLEKGYQVTGYHTDFLEECSPLCRKYGEAFEAKTHKLTLVETTEQIELPNEGIFLDGILGTGFKGAPSEKLQFIFKHVNQSQVPVISIDVPSGLNGDSGEVQGEAVEASHTIFLGLPKKGFFIRDGWNHVGRLECVHFGLDEKYLDQAHAEFELIQEVDVQNLFPKMVRNRHKYEAGFVVGITGSKGMMGASILSGMSALRSGSGIVKLIHLDHEFTDQAANPELIHLNLSSSKVDEALEIMERASAIYLGPGMGISESTSEFIRTILPHIQKPCVIDADALTLIAQEKLSFPKGALITPHVGEMHRLLGQKPQDPLEVIKLCKKYALEHEVTLLLKGGPSFIFHDKELPKINPTGDPGMATAGSGDVLTGMLAGLLSQIGMNPIKAATLGVFLHGKVGEIVAHKKSSYCVTASDLVKFLYKVFKK
ncbi:MAG: ATP-dependent (S)-NAD(P)H-hydrate dehydratase [Chlamydiae bacterium]|nr:ATP-dependent (S)-NAD(P)H-hydrate dehydratase [Chlamydiota bacterium]